MNKGYRILAFSLAFIGFIYIMHFAPSFVGWSGGVFTYSPDVVYIPAFNLMTFSNSYLLLLILGMVFAAFPKHCIALTYSLIPYVFRKPPEISDKVRDIVFTKPSRKYYLMEIIMGIAFLIVWTMLIVLMDWALTYFVYTNPSMSSSMYWMNSFLNTAMDYSALSICIYTLYLIISGMQRLLWDGSNTDSLPESA